MPVVTTFHHQKFLEVNHEMDTTRSTLRSFHPKVMMDLKQLQKQQPSKNNSSYPQQQQQVLQVSSGTERTDDTLLMNNSSISNNSTDDCCRSTTTIAEEAQKIIEYRFQDSKFGNSSNNVLNDIPTFSKLEVEVGIRLGQGGFSNVREIRGIYLRPPSRKMIKTKDLSLVQQHQQLQGTGEVLVEDNEVEESDPRRFPILRGDTVALNDIESRQFIATHAIRSSGDTRYALKSLRPTISDTPDRLLLGLVDLAIETRFLSSLEHPNIIKLRAISDADPYSLQYFLILDRLYDTLEVRIYKTWLKQQQQQQGRQSKRTLRMIRPITKYFCNRTKKQQQQQNQQQQSETNDVQRRELYQERLIYSFDLSDALRYLHSNSILHRDLKPENIGFDVRGDIKIFDFGMGRELRKQDYNEENGLYRNMSRMTGTLRYMAPEVYLGHEYNSSCDVYSFAILLWEIMALEKPFTNKNMKLKNGARGFVQQVIFGGKRPTIPQLTNTKKKNKKKKKSDPKMASSCWPETLQDILRKSWAANWQDRYTMEEVSNILRQELVGLRGGDDSGLEHQRRRSTYVFEPDVIESVLEGLELSDDDEENDIDDHNRHAQQGHHGVDTSFDLRSLMAKSRSVLGRAILGGGNADSSSPGMDPSLQTSDDNTTTRRTKSLDPSNLRSHMLKSRSSGRFILDNGGSSSTAMSRGLQVTADDNTTRRTTSLDPSNLRSHMLKSRSIGRAILENGGSNSTEAGRCLQAIADDNTTRRTKSLDPSNNRSHMLKSQSIGRAILENGGSSSTETGHSLQATDDNTTRRTKSLDPSNYRSHMLKSRSIGRAIVDSMGSSTRNLQTTGTSLNSRSLLPGRGGGDSSPRNSGTSSNHDMRSYMVW